MKIDIDGCYFSGRIPLAQKEFIETFSSVSTETEFITRLSSVHRWEEVDKNPTDLRAWIKVLNRIDSIYEKYLKFNQAQLIIVPLSETDPDYEQSLAEALAKEKSEIEAEAYDTAKLSITACTAFLGMLLENANHKEIFSSVDYLKELLGARSEHLEELALRALSGLVKTPAPHLHPDGSGEEPDTAAQGDMSLSKLLLCFAQGFGSQSQGLDLVSVVLKANEDLPDFPGKLVYDFHRSPDPRIDSKKGLLMTKVCGSPLVNSEKTCSTNTPRKQPLHKIENGLVRIVVSQDELRKNSQDALFDKALRRYDIPRKNRFSFLQRLRMAKSFLTKEGRERRIHMRLQSLAVLFKIASAGELMTAYVTHEPELTGEIVALVRKTSVESLQNNDITNSDTEAQQIPFKIKLAALQVLQRLPGSFFENTTNRASISSVGRQSNILQHLGILKVQTNGFLSRTLHDLLHQVDDIFPLEVYKETSFFLEESKSDNTVFDNTDDELGFAFGVSFAITATEFVREEENNKAREYIDDLFLSTDDTEQSLHTTRNKEEVPRDMIFYIQNLLYLSASVAGTQHGAVFMATTGIVNMFASLLRNDLAILRKINDNTRETTGESSSVGFGKSRIQFLSLILLNLSCCLAVSTTALNLVHDLDLASLIILFLEETLLNQVLGVTMIKDRKRPRSRRSKTKKARSRKRLYDELNTPPVDAVVLDIEKLKKEPSRLLTHGSQMPIVLREIPLEVRVFVRDLMQFLLLLVQRCDDGKHPNLGLKNENSKLLHSLKLFFEQTEVFSPGNFNMASTLLVEVVNFEPSSIYNVYRHGLQTVLCNMLIKGLVPPDAQSISVLPNILNVLCLHSDGEKLMKDEKIMPRLVVQLLKKDLLLNSHQVRYNFETNEREEIHEMCGNNLDHFLRHHKVFRKEVIGFLLEGLQSIEEKKMEEELGEKGSKHSAPARKSKPRSKKELSMIVQALAAEPSKGTRNEFQSQRVQRLTGLLMILQVVVKNREVVDLLFTEKGLLFLLPSYLMLVPKSFFYIVRSGTEYNNYEGAKVLTDIIASVMYHENFPRGALAKLQKTITALYRHRGKAESSPPTKTFQLLDLIPDNLTVSDVRDDLERKKKALPHTKGGRNILKFVAREVKCLGFLEWLMQLLTAWLTKTGSTSSPNARKKATDFYSLCLTKNKDNDFRQVFLLLCDMQIQILQDRFKFLHETWRFQEQEDAAKEADQSQRNEGSLRKPDDDANRNLRYQVSLELHRLNRSFASLVVNMNDLMVHVFVPTLKDNLNLDEYSQFIDLVMLPVLRKLFDATSEDQIQTAFLQADAIDLLASLLKGRHTNRSNLFFAHKLFISGFLDEACRKASSLLAFCLDTFAREIDANLEKDKLRTLYKTVHKIGLSVTKLFSIIGFISDEGPKRDTLMAFSNGHNDLKKLWDLRGSDMTDVKTEIEAYPFHFATFSLQLKLLLLPRISEIFEQNSFGLLASAEFSLVRRFLLEVTHYLFRKQMADSFVQIFPESYMYELNVHKYADDAFDQFKKDVEKVSEPLSTPIQTTSSQKINRRRIKQDQPNSVSSQASMEEDSKTDLAIELPTQLIREREQAKDRIGEDRRKSFRALRNSFVENTFKATQMAWKIISKFYELPVSQRSNPSSKVSYGFGSFDDVSDFLQGIARIIESESLLNIEGDPGNHGVFLRGLANNLVTTGEHDIPVVLFLAALNRFGALVKILGLSLRLQMIDVLHNGLNSFISKVQEDRTCIGTKIPAATSASIILLSTLLHDREQEQTVKHPALLLTCLNLLKIAIKLQSKVDTTSQTKSQCAYFQESDIIGILVLLERLTCSRKAVEAFLRYNGFGLIFRLNGSELVDRKCGILAQLILKMLSDEATNRSQYAQMLYTELKLERKGFSTSFVPIGRLREAKSLMLFLHGLNESLFLDTFQELFRVKKHAERSAEAGSGTSLLIDMKEEAAEIIKTYARQKPNHGKSPKPGKTDKARKTVFTQFLAEFSSTLQADFFKLQPVTPSKKKNSNSSDVAMHLSFYLKVFRNILNSYPLLTEQLVAKTKLADGCFTFISDVNVKFLGSKNDFVEATNEEIYLYNLLVRGIGPLAYAFAKESETYVADGVVAHREDFELAIQELHLFIGDIQKHASPQTITAILLEICNMLKSLENVADKSRRLSLRQATLQGESKFFNSRMWTINGLVLLMQRILFETKTYVGARRTSKDVIGQIKALFEKKVVKLLVNSLNALSPHHTKVYLCVTNILSLLDSLSKESTLKRVKTVRTPQAGGVAKNLEHAEEVLSESSVEGSEIQFNDSEEEWEEEFLRSENDQGSWDEDDDEQSDEETENVEMSGIEEEEDSEEEEDFELLEEEEEDYSFDGEDDEEDSAFDESVSSDIDSQLEDVPDIIELQEIANSEDISGEHGLILQEDILSGANETGGEVSPIDENSDEQDGDSESGEATLISEEEVEQHQRGGQGSRHRGSQFQETFLRMFMGNGMTRNRGAQDIFVPFAPGGQQSLMRSDLTHFFRDLISRDGGSLFPSGRQRNERVNFRLGDPSGRLRNFTFSMDMGDAGGQAYPFQFTAAPSSDSFRSRGVAGSYSPVPLPGLPDYSKKTRKKLQKKLLHETRVDPLSRFHPMLVSDTHAYKHLWQLVVMKVLKRCGVDNTPKHSDTSKLTEGATEKSEIESDLAPLQSRTETEPFQDDLMGRLGDVMEEDADMNPESLLSFTVAADENDLIDANAHSTQPEASGDRMEDVVGEEVNTRVGDSASEQLQEVSVDAARVQENEAELAEQVYGSIPNTGSTSPGVGLSGMSPSLPDQPTTTTEAGENSNAGDELASFIASLADVQLRQDVFLSLTQAQINSLPAHLRSEAESFRGRTLFIPPTTFVPATTERNTGRTPQANPTENQGSTTTTGVTEKAGLDLDKNIIGFEDLLGEKEIESLLKLFFHLRQGKKSAHRNVLMNFVSHDLFREMILFKILQLLRPNIPGMSLNLCKSIDRRQKTFTFSISRLENMEDSDKKKVQADRKWIPNKIVGTSDTIFTMYASQSQAVPGFIPFLALRRSLETLKSMSQRSNRISVILLERPYCLELLLELLTVKQYKSNLKYMVLIVEIICAAAQPLLFYKRVPVDSEQKTEGKYYPVERIIAPYYMSCLVDLVASERCSDELFSKVKAAAKLFSAVEANKKAFADIITKAATANGEIALTELLASPEQIINENFVAPLRFYRLLKLLMHLYNDKELTAQNRVPVLGLKIELQNFFDGLVHRIKQSTSSSSKLKKSHSSAELDSTFASPLLNRALSKQETPRRASLALPNMDLLAQNRKKHVHSLALSAAQANLTMLKSFFLVCMIIGPDASRLLVEFTYRFKNILNSLIHQNPTLLEGDFRLMLAHPRCKATIDFQNKQLYFRNQVKKIKASKRSPTVKLHVRRNQLFEDSYGALANKSPAEMLGKLSVQFANEEGVDAGGVTREYFQILCREMFQPGYCLFKPSTDSSAYQPDPRSAIDEHHLDYFKFIGRMVAKALFDGILIDAHFTRSFYKHILSLPISHRDMDSLDPQFYKSLCDLLTMNIDELDLDLTFTTDEREFGVVKTVELKPNGQNISVTDENKMEYVQLCTKHKMTTGIKSQIDAFLKGFQDILPKDLIAIFNEQELELLISGVPEVNLEDLKNNTEYVGYSAESVQVKWFWKTIESWPKEDHAQFLMFVTGTSKVPLEGFKKLVGMRGFQKFSIHKSFKNDQILPSAHTCFNQLDLPEYSTEKVLKEKLSYAVQEGGEGFGFR